LKAQAKSICIAVLVLVIIGGGYWFWNMYSDYKHKVDDVLEYSIYSNLNATQQQLINLRDELKQYNDKQISSEAFYEIIHEPVRDYFLYGDYTYRFGRIEKRFRYLDYADLNGYLLSLNEQLPAEEVEYHKENLMKIIKLWAPLTFDAMDNYLEPKEEVRELIEKTNILANEGMDRIEKKSETNP
jgi:hypothetical protein